MKSECEMCDKEFNPDESGLQGICAECEVEMDIDDTELLSEVEQPAMPEVEYKATLIMRSPFMVGYHPKKDEIFLYFVDQDELGWVFARGGLDSVGFPEFMDFSEAEWLGEL